MRVSNGDGSFQNAAGEVTLKLRLGPRFAQHFSFVVIDLAHYDIIIGFPDIRAYKLGLRCDPVRVWYVVIEEDCSAERMHVLHGLRFCSFSLLPRCTVRFCSFSLLKFRVSKLTKLSEFVFEMLSV